MCTHLTLHRTTTTAAATPTTSSQQRSSLYAEKNNDQRKNQGHCYYERDRTSLPRLCLRLLVSYRVALESAFAICGFGIVSQPIRSAYLLEGICDRWAKESCLGTVVVSPPSPSSLAFRYANEVGMLLVEPLLLSPFVPSRSDTATTGTYDTNLMHGGVAEA